MRPLETILSLPTVTHALLQGSPEWSAFRLAHRGASEAAAMLGLSRKFSRSELLRMKHSGVAREFSDWLRRNVLDHGHEVEAMARSVMESMLGAELYPVTCSRGRLSASCDGLTVDDETAFEHKQWNEDLAAMVQTGNVPDEHMPQCQQILLVTGAKRVRFTVSDGTRERMVWADVEPDLGWWERIVAGWEQFDADLASYQPQAVVQPAEPVVVELLPAVSVRMEGALTVFSNLDQWGPLLRAFIDKIPAQPVDDRDFGLIDAACKRLKGVEEELAAEEARALSGMVDVEKLRRVVADLRNLARTTRLQREKLVEARKLEIRTEEINRGKAALAESIANLNATIGKPYMPAIAADFPGAIKGLRTVQSVRDAIDQELARARIAANEACQRIVINMRHLRELASEHAFLFADTPQLVLKAEDDCKAVIQARIGEHREKEEKRLAAERERIRAEEAARLEREAQARQRAELEAAQAQERALRQRELEERERQQAASTVDADLQKAPPVQEQPGPGAAVHAIRPTPAPAAQRTLTLGVICERLGFNVTQAFLTTLGFQAEKQRNATLYFEEDFDLMCTAIAAHCTRVRDQRAAA